MHIKIPASLYRHGLKILVALFALHLVLSCALAADKGTAMKPEISVIHEVGHVLAVECLAFSPDGSTLASGGNRDNTVILWDARTLEWKQTLTGHTDTVAAVAFDPKGNLLASVSKDQTVKLWNAKTGLLLRTLTGHQRALQAVAFSPDSRVVVSAGRDGAVKFWDVQTGVLQLALSFPQQMLRSLAFSPDGAFLAIASEKSVLPLPSGKNNPAATEIKIWDISQRELKRTLARVEESKESGAAGLFTPVVAVAYSPNGTLLASASGSQVTLWDARSGEARHVLTAPSGKVISVTFSPDGGRVVAGTGDAQSPTNSNGTALFQVWDTRTGQPIAKSQGRLNTVTSVAFSPDGKTLASGSYFEMVQLWDAETGALKQKQEHHISFASTFAFSPDGTMLATPGEPVRLWDMRTGKLQRTFTSPRDNRNRGDLRAVTFSADGKTLVGATTEKTLLLWDIRTGELRDTLVSGSSRLDSDNPDWSSPGVATVAFSPDNRMIAAGGVGATVRLWDVATKTMTHTLKAHPNWTYAVTFSPDSRVLATAQREVKLWDLQKGTLLRTLEGNTQDIKAIAFSPNGLLLAGVGTRKGPWQRDAVRGRLDIWEARSGRLLLSIPAHADSINGVAWSPDGKTVATGGSRSGGDWGGQWHEGEINLWDARAGKLLRTMTAGGATVGHIAFSPDGRTLVSSGITLKNWTLRTGPGMTVWNVATGEHLATLAVLPSGNDWITYTPEGFYDGSLSAARYIRWQMGEQFLPAETYAAQFHHPERVEAALRPQSRVTKSP